MNRRDFLLSLVAGATTATSAIKTYAAPDSTDSIGQVLPKRKLGRNGPEVTCLGLGGYHIGWTTEALAQATIEAALAEGVRFFDTSESYGPHTSEERYGKYLTPKYRSQIFLMTKSDAKDAASARASIEGSLSRLKTDVIDLWQLHALETPADVDARLDGGVLSEALKARREGKIRHIGFTGHSSPYAHLRLLERTADEPTILLTCQLPISVVDAASKHSFITHTVPVLQQRGVGILAMKTLADGHFFATKTVNDDKVVWQTKDPVVPNRLTLEECIHFALSLPISVLISGAEKPEYIRDKAAFVRNFHNLPEAQRKTLIEKAASIAAAGEVEYYKAKDLKG
jgi:uncharacterized protein